MGATADIHHGNGHGGYGDDDFRELADWRDHARVMLQPVAAPSVLGLFGFTIATFMVTANLVGWFGTSASPLTLFPLAAATGGVAQGVAAIWAYRARDVLATAVHGTWASFWLAYGLLNLLVAVGTLPAPPAHGPVPELGYWFFPLAAITLVCALASLAESMAITATLTLLTAGAACLGIFYVHGGTTWQHIAGYVTMAAAFAAFYTGTAMLLAGTWGRAVLPVGKYDKAAVVPGHRPMYAIQFAEGEPGVRRGQ